MDKIKNKYCIYICIASSIIALIFSIIAMCNVFPRSLCRGFDYLGLIVGLLALITTVLVGWQIYQIVKFDGLLNKMESHNLTFQQYKTEINETHEKIHSAQQLIDGGYKDASLSYVSMCDGNMEMYRDLYNQTHDKRLQYRAIYWGVEAVYVAYLKLENYDKCEDFIKNIVFCNKDFSDITCTEVQKKYLIDTVAQIKNPEKIKSFNELKSILNGIKISDEAIPYLDSVITEL